MKLPGNMKSMMKQAEKMKQQMEQLQEKAGEEIIEVSSGGGMVKVSAKAKGEILSITIEDEIIESKDKEMMQDLIQAAINESLEKGKTTIKETMNKAAAAMGIPPGTSLKLEMKHKVLGKEIERLINALSKLPSIGNKTASRLSLFLMKNSPELTMEIARSMVEARKKVKTCQICNNFIFNNICLCMDSTRDKRTLCIVENVFDLISIENSNEFNGQYHVLQGLLSVSQGIGPEDLKIDLLIDRIKKNMFEEIIFATDPTNDGEFTAQYIKERASKYCKKISRIAIGMPIGSEVDYIDQNTLTKAFLDRRKM